MTNAQLQWSPEKVLMKTQEESSTYPLDSLKVKILILPSIRVKQLELSCIVDTRCDD